MLTILVQAAATVKWCLRRVVVFQHLLWLKLAVAETLYYSNPTSKVSVEFPIQFCFIFIETVNSQIIIMSSCQL